MSALTAIRCVYCQRPGRLAVCRGCTVERRPTALAEWMRQTGVGHVELARRVGVTRMTIYRASMGTPLSRRVALDVSRETGIPAHSLVMGHEYAIKVAESVRGAAGHGGDRAPVEAVGGDGRAARGDPGGYRAACDDAPGRGRRDG